MNPGSPTPQAGILNQFSGNSPSIPTKLETETIAIRRPQDEIKYKEQIEKTIEKARNEGKQPNTIKSFYHRLRQLSKVSNLMNPEDVKKAIAYARLANSSKCSFVLAYQWFVNANGLKWEKPRYKWENHIPIIPTTNQVHKIISASTRKFAVIFNLMAETGVEGEELHQTHRNQYDQTQHIISIKGLKDTVRKPTN